MPTDKIVIVDDDPAIARMLTFMLNRKGYKTVVAVDGKEAMAKIRQLEPPLVFLDLMMPKMDGFQVCQEIRNDTTLSRQPYIIMITARGRTGDPKKAKEVGVDEFLTKPFRPSTLITQVEKVLG